MSIYMQSLLNLLAKICNASLKFTAIHSFHFVNLNTKLQLTPYINFTSVQFQIIIQCAYKIHTSKFQWQSEILFLNITSDIVPIQIYT